MPKKPTPIRAKPMRVRVAAELSRVIADLRAQQLTAPSVEHQLAFTAALVAVLGCRLAVRRAKTDDAVENHLLILRDTLEGLESVLQAQFGDPGGCIERAKKITVH